MADKEKRRVIGNGLQGNYVVLKGGMPWKSGLTAQGACALLSDFELQQTAVRVNCENELNRQAGLELKRRGYQFSTDEQKWVKR